MERRGGGYVTAEAERRVMQLQTQDQVVPAAAAWDITISPDASAGIWVWHFGRKWIGLFSFFNFMLVHWAYGHLLQYSQTSYNTMFLFGYW